MAKSGYHPSEQDRMKDELFIWLRDAFGAAGRDVPLFETTPDVLEELHHLAMLSRSRNRAEEIIAADYREKASEFRQEADRLIHILGATGVTTENLSLSGSNSAKVLASTADRLDLADTNDSSYYVAMAKLLLDKAEVDDRRRQLKKESSQLLQMAQKTVAHQNQATKMIEELEKRAEEELRAQELWPVHMETLLVKKNQYKMQIREAEASLARVGYSEDITHGRLQELAYELQQVEEASKPLKATLQAYRNLPPDMDMAQLHIERASKRLEDAQIELAHLTESLAQA